MQVGASSAFPNLCGVLSRCAALRLELSCAISRCDLNFITLSLRGLEENFLSAMADGTILQEQLLLKVYQADSLILQGKAYNMFAALVAYIDSLCLIIVSSYSERALKDMSWFFLNILVNMPQLQVYVYSYPRS